MKKREESKSSEWNFTADLTKFKEVRKSSTERKKKKQIFLFFFIDILFTFQRLEF